MPVSLGGEPEPIDGRVGQIGTWFIGHHMHDIQTWGARRWIRGKRYEELRVVGVSR